MPDDHRRIGDLHDLSDLTDSDPDAEVVRGGQGRSAEEVEGSAVVVAFALISAAFFPIAALGVWALWHYLFR